MKNVDLTELRRTVERDIDSYEYLVPQTAAGNSWTSEKVNAGLRRMRESLVEPYWLKATLQDTLRQISLPESEIRELVVVADNLQGTLLALDPTEEEYVLIQEHTGSMATFRSARRFRRLFPGNLT